MTHPLSAKPIEGIPSANALRGNAQTQVVQRENRLAEIVPYLREGGQFPRTRSFAHNARRNLLVANLAITFCHEVDFPAIRRVAATPCTQLQRQTHCSRAVVRPIPEALFSGRLSAAHRVGSV